MSLTVTDASLPAVEMEPALTIPLNLRKLEKSVVISKDVLTSSNTVYPKSAIKLLANVSTRTNSIIKTVRRFKLYRMLSEMKVNLKVLI